MSSEESTEIDIDIKVNNIHCTFNVRCLLNIEDIMERGVNVELRKNRDGIKMQLREPPAMATIWPTGKITCTGPQSENDARIACRRIARKLQNLGYPVRFTSFKIHNCHATVKLPFPIKTIEFSKAHPEASYEPELHVGVIYKVESFKATVTIHRTGNMIIFAPSEEKIKQAVEYVAPLVEPFKNIKPKRRIKKKSSNQTGSKSRFLKEDPNQEEDWLPETEDIPLAKLKDRHTKSKAKKMGKYRILRFNGFTQSTSLSVLQNERGWHCSSCQYVGKDRNHLKKHILKRHRHEKKLMM